MVEKRIIVCSFYNRCKNYPKECWNCKWNANNLQKDFLLMETKEGKTIKFLET